MNIRKNAVKGLALLIAAFMLTSCTNNTNTPEQSGDNSQQGSQSSDSGSESQTPSVPDGEWSFGQMAMGGGGYVTGVFSTCEEGLFYARTDVGGAYRWDKEKEKWVSLAYRISEENVGLMGIDGLAVDPDEANKLYLLAGTSYFSNGKTCVMISEDYGENFEIVDVTDKITASGNGMGRQNGERIAIDPVDNNIIYVGGRTGGLIKSVDGGKTWETMDGLAQAASVNTINGNGVCTIVIDPESSDGSKCTRIFAGISATKQENMLVSEDGGETWKGVEGAPQGLFPQRMRLDGQGNILITYANTEGPWGSSLGGIRKYSISSGEFTDISPSKQSFGDIAVSPSDPNKMVAVTECIWMEQPNGAFGDQFYVTSDGGASWTCINESMKFKESEVSWINSAAIHWSGCLCIDPFNENAIKVTSGNGIFACGNIWDEAPEFYFDSCGLEETVPMGLVSLPDGPLISAVLDYDGFVNDDPFTYGTMHSSAAGAMTDIAVAMQNRDVWVKCGGDGSAVGFWYTLDGGKTWQQAKSNPSNGANQGVCGVTADGKRFFWSPDGAAVLYYTDDYGETWEQSTGIYITSSVVSDAVNPDYVYASSSGSFYVSEDGGKTFTETLTFFASSSRVTVSPYKEGVVYIPAMGLQVSADHGKTFTRLDSAAGCLGVGVGKGVSDEQEAIYIWGRPTADDPLGIYWSVDGGQSWSVVSTEYQFGGMGNGHFIKGDSNVCGRCYISTVGLGIAVCSLES